MLASHVTVRWNLLILREAEKMYKFLRAKSEEGKCEAPFIAELIGKRRVYNAFRQWRTWYSSLRCFCCIYISADRYLGSGKDQCNATLLTRPIEKTSVRVPPSYNQRGIHNNNVSFYLHLYSSKKKRGKKRKVFLSTKQKEESNVMWYASVTHRILFTMILTNLYIPAFEVLGFLKHSSSVHKPKVT